MTMTRLFVRLHQIFAAHRRAGIWCVGVFFAACLVGMPFLRPVENVASLIPDDHSGLAQDFRLLQKAPFTGRMLIDVAAPPGADARALANAGDALAGALAPSVFPEVNSGPRLGDPSVLITHMLDLLPALFTQDDLVLARKKLAPEAVRNSLRECMRLLGATEGIGMQGVIRRDPLGLSRLALAKLAHLRLSDALILQQGHFISADGRHLLIIVRPAAAMTDSNGAREVVEAFSRAKTVLPAGYAATLMGGHRHTAANAAAIRSDMSMALCVSLVGLTLLFLLCLRTRAGFFAFLLPLAVVPPAAIATRLAFGAISGITIGFGSVLMGVAADYSIYVYFTLRAQPGPAGGALERAAPPVWYGAATSMAAFAALLCSSLPGIRELAFFSLVGLCLALFLALAVLPSFVPPGGALGKRRERPARRPVLSPRQALVLVMIILAAGAYFGAGVRFDADLRNLSASGADIKRDEAAIRSVWGDVRDKAILFAEGPSLDQALEASGRFFERAAAAQDAANLISLAPVLPSDAVQSANIERWRSLFDPARRAQLRDLVEAEAAALGFTPDAFAPFFASLAAAPLRATPERLRAAGLGEAVDLLLAQDGADFLAISLMPDGPYVGEAKASLEHIRIVSQSAFGRELTVLLKKDCARFILLAFCGNLLLLCLLLRRVGPALVSLLPTVVGLAALFGVMGGLGMHLNLFGVIAIPLIIGMGVDYGVFMTLEGAGAKSGATVRAVVVAGLSTVVGFGALALARHPALHSIGLTVLIGLIGAVAAACVLVAPLRGRRE